MTTAQKTKYILNQLHQHAPFTLAGALLGVAFMLLFRALSLPEQTGHFLFDIFHPGHVLLSAMATAAMFKLHARKHHFLTILIIGYVGSVGIATLSDCIIPYAGEVLLGFHVEAHPHEHNSPPQPNNPQPDSEHAQGHEHSLHLGFIERWWLVNPLAILGVVFAYIRPRTKFPHAGHVLLSIWASLSHILMALGTQVSFAQWLGVVVFLFLAVWLPCCISDIVFPLLFVKPGEPLSHHHHH